MKQKCERCPNIIEETAAGHIVVDNTVNPKRFYWICRACQKIELDNK